MPIGLAKLVILVSSLAFVVIPTTGSMRPVPVWLHVRIRIRKLKTPLSASLFVLMPTFSILPFILIPMPAILVPMLVLLATTFRSVMHFLPNLLF